MKLIGVTGKSGAGKTTFSNVMSQNYNFGVIHVDDLLRELKLKYFRLIMNTNNKGEKTKVNGKLKMMLYKNKLIFHLFMKFRAKLLKKRINSKIKELQDNGKDTIIIDDIFIKFLHIYNDLDKVFIIERPYKERKEALKKRDNLTLQEIVAYDIAHFKGVYNDVSIGNNVEKILNNESKESFMNKAKEIYNKYFISSKEQFKRGLNNDVTNNNAEYQEQKQPEIKKNKAKAIEK